MGGIPMLFLVVLWTLITNMTDELVQLRAEVALLNTTVAVMNEQIGRVVSDETRRQP